MDGCGHTVRKELWECELLFELVLVEGNGREEKAEEEEPTSRRERWGKGVHCTDASSLFCSSHISSR